MRNLLQIIREEVSPEDWNQAVKIARSQQVHADRSAPANQEIILHVVDPRTKLTAKVSLWPDDEDWHCTMCSEACKHVAAAVIAQVQGFVQKAEENSNLHRPFLQYEFRPIQSPDGKYYLQLFRFFKNAQDEVQSIGRSLVGLQGRVLYDQEDLEIDQFFLKHEDARYDRGFWIKLWPLLKNKTILFQGEKATLSEQRRGFLLRGSKQGGAFLLRLEKEDTDFVYDNGLAQKGQEFSIASRLADDPWGSELYEKGRLFGNAEIDRLRAEYLPRLQASFTTTVDLEQEAAKDYALPRLVIESTKQDGGIMVRAKIVYGDPVQAEFDGRNFKQVSTSLPRRRLDLEETLLKKLEKDYGLSLGEARLWGVQEAQHWANKLSKQGHDVFTEPQDFFSFRNLGQVRLHSEWNVAKQEPTMQMEILGSGQQRRLSVDELSNLLARSRDVNGQRLIDWLGQGLVALPETWSRDHDLLVKKLINERDRGEAKLSQYWTLRSFRDEKSSEGWNADLNRVLSDEELLSRRGKVPADLWQRLRPYQQEGVDFLLRMQLLGAGALLADEMGLGKTVQAMAVLQAGSLIVCPASLIFNWQEELQKFRPDLSINLYHGKNRSLDKDADLVLTSYGIVRQDWELCARRTWQTILIDEAQAIKNESSEISFKIKQIPARWRLALSGTPMENDLRDLISLQQFLNPRLLEVELSLRKAGNLDAQFFKTWLEPFYLRRRKQQVLKDLPDRSDILVRLEPNEHEQKLYRQEISQVFAQWQQQKEQGANFTQILALLTRLRRAACDYRVALNQDEGNTLPTKMQYLLEKVPVLTVQGHSVIIVSQWTSMLDRLRTDLDNQGLACLQLDGRTRDRGDIVKRFSQKEAPVLLLSLKAGGVGLNLTVADHIFLLDPWWNVSAEEQAFARIHRIGQERPVFMHRLLALGTIEEHVFRLQSQKQEIFNQVFENDLENLQISSNQQTSQDLIQVLEMSLQDSL